jgi:hypothetical protein
MIDLVPSVARQTRDRGRFDVCIAHTSAFYGSMSYLSVTNGRSYGFVGATAAAPKRNIEYPSTLLLLAISPVSLGGILDDPHRT